MVNMGEKAVYKHFLLFWKMRTELFFLTFQGWIPAVELIFYMICNVKQVVNLLSTYI